MADNFEPLQVQPLLVDGRMHFVATCATDSDLNSFTRISDPVHSEVQAPAPEKSACIVHPSIYYIGLRWPVQTMETTNHEGNHQLEKASRDSPLA